MLASAYAAGLCMQVRALHQPGLTLHSECECKVPKHLTALCQPNMYPERLVPSIHAATGQACTEVSTYNSFVKLDRGKCLWNFHASLRALPAMREYRYLRRKPDGLSLYVRCTGQQNGLLLTVLLRYQPGHLGDHCKQQAQCMHECADNNCLGS